MKWSYSQKWKQTSCCLTLVTRFGWISLAYLAENFERFEAKGYKHHPNSRRICKHFTRSCKTDFVKLCKEPSYVWEIINCWKNWRTCYDFEDIYNRPPSLSWNWVPMIFLWAPGEDVFLRNSFSTSRAIANNLEVQDQFCDLGNESSAHDTFHGMPFSRF